LRGRNLHERLLPTMQCSFLEFLHEKIIA